MSGSSERDGDQHRPLFVRISQMRPDQTSNADEMRQGREGECRQTKPCSRILMHLTRLSLTFTALRVRVCLPVGVFMQY